GGERARGGGAPDGTGTADDQRTRHRGNVAAQGFRAARAEASQNSGVTKSVQPVGSGRRTAYIRGRGRFVCGCATSGEENNLRRLLALPALVVGLGLGVLVPVASA